MKLWIEHLALQHTAAPEAKSSWLIAEDGLWKFSEVPDAEKILRQLLEIYFLGLTRPLPFFSATSFTFAIPLGPRAKKTAMDLAQEKWDGDDYGDSAKGDSQDAYFNLCFRNVAEPLDAEFAALAKTIVEPLIAHRTEEDSP